MKFDELANLVTVRNHLDFLMSQRNIVSKDKYKSLEKIKAQLDERFLIGLNNIETNNSFIELKEKESDNVVVKSGAVVVHGDSDDNVIEPVNALEANRKPKKKTKKKTSRKKKASKKTASSEDKEISKQIENTKKELTEKKGSFRRSDA